MVNSELYVLPLLYDATFTRSKIDVVTCRLDNRVYVRKSIDKKFALRTRDVSNLTPSQILCEG